MSAFDKFNVNPYIRTYAGSPVEQFQQTAGALQNRYYKNLDYADKLSAGLSNIQGLGEDNEYLNQLKKEYRDQIAAASEAPELATRQVRNLGRKFAQDEKLMLITQNKAKLDAINKQIEEGDLSPYQVQKVTDALQAYSAAGGAAGQQKLSLPQLYEEADINKEIDERVKGIKGFETGISRIVTEADGTKYVYSNTGDKVSVDKILGTARGVFNNPKIQRQLQDELRYRNRGLQEGDEGYVTDAQLMEQYIQPAIYKYEEAKNVEKITNLSTSGSGRGSGGGGVKGTSTALSQAEAPSLHTPYTFGEDPEVNMRNQVIMSRAAEDRVNAWNAGETPIVNGKKYTAAQADQDAKLVSLHKTSFKQALLDEKTIKDPGLRDLLGGATEDQLFDLRTRELNTEGAAADLQQRISSGDLPDLSLGGVAKAVKDMAASHGPEAATVLLQELTNNPNASYGRNTQYGAYERLKMETRQEFPDLRGAEFEDAVAMRVARALDQAATRIQELDGQSVAEFDPEKAKALIKQLYPNVNQKQLDAYVQTMDTEITGEYFAASFDNKYQDKLNGMIQERHTQPANVVLTEQEIKNHENSIASQFNMELMDESNLEAFMVKNTEGKMESLLENKDLLDDYNLTEGGITLDRVDSQGGSGYVELLIKPKTGSGKDPLRLTVDLDAAGFVDFRPNVAQNALAKYSAATTPREREAYYSIYSSFGMAEEKAEIRKAFKLNGVEDRGDNAIKITDGFLSTAFGGPIQPQKDADGYFNFVDFAGNKIFTDGGVKNTDLAMQKVYEYAQTRMSQAAARLNQPAANNDNSAE